MTDRFGMSHRQQVRDVNAGKITPDVPDAVKGRRSGAQSRAADRVVGVNLGPTGADVVRQALLRGAGVVGEQVSRENQRKAKLEGQILAGSEEGKAVVAREKDTLATKIFGPTAKVRSAEERIVKDEIDTIHIKLKKDLDTFGHQKTPEEWQAHTVGKLGEVLDKYDDEDLKDQITARYGANSAVLMKDYEMKREFYTQELNRKTWSKSATKGAELAQLDLDSGSAERLYNVDARYEAALAKDPDMSDTAYNSAMADVLKNEFSANRPGMYEYAKNNGMLEDLDYEDEIELQQAADIYKSKTDVDFMVSMQELTKLANDGDIAGVKQLGPQLMRQHPKLFKAGLGKYVQVAWDAATDKQAENRKRTAAKMYAQTGDSRLHTDLTSAERVEAVEGSIRTSAEQSLRAKHKDEAQRRGVEYDPQAPITDIQLQDELLKTVEEWGPRYVHAETQTPIVKRMANRVAFDLRNPELPSDKADQVAANVQQMMKLRELDEVGFSKHLSVADAGRVTAVANMIEAGKGMPEIWQVLHPKKKEPQRKLTVEEKETVDSISADVVGQFREKYVAKHTEGLDFGMWDEIDEFSMKDLQARVKREVTSAYADTSDSFMAEGRAYAAVISKAAVQGNKIVFDGKFLDTPEVSWDRYLRGFEDSDEVQRALEEQGMQGGFKLRNGRTVPDANGGGGATIFVPADIEGHPDLAIPIKLPQFRQQILPTQGMGLGEIYEPIPGVDMPDPTQSPDRWTEQDDEANNGAGPLSSFISPAGAADEAMAPTSDVFRTTLASVENSVQAGFDQQTQRWKPHVSPEGGRKTLAFGHKLTQQEAQSGIVNIGGYPVDINQGITQKQAWALLDQDIDKAGRKLSKSISGFDTLPEKYQNVLVNIAFNTGSVTEGSWPKLLSAMRRGDDAAVRKEMVTVYTDSKGTKKRLTQRATDVANAVGI